MKREREPNFVIRSRDVQPIASCDGGLLAGAIVCFWLRLHEELWVDMDDVGGAGVRSSYHVTKDRLFQTPIFRQCSEEETAARFCQIDLAERAVPHGM